jgi:hypothetical protein
VEDKRFNLSQLPLLLKKKLEEELLLVVKIKILYYLTGEKPYQLPLQEVEVFSSQNPQLKRV